VTPYERGFEAGEAACHADKKQGRPMLVRPEKTADDYARGWWDGYTPRSLTWALHRAPIKSYAESE